MNISDAAYWDSRYAKDDFPWDAGAPTQPLTDYIDQLTDKTPRILIPGGGLGHELAYLLAQGFLNSYLLDFAPQTAARIHSLYPDIPTKHILTEDFFAHGGSYDLILEQTFFCALNPARRQAYADHMHRLLVPGGKLVGVMFNFPLSEEGPPFGGDADEYRAYFHAFSQVEITPCENSIKPRAGKELFIEITK